MKNFFLILPLIFLFVSCLTQEDDPSGIPVSFRAFVASKLLVHYDIERKKLSMETLEKSAAQRFLIPDKGITHQKAAEKRRLMWRGAEYSVPLGRLRYFSETYGIYYYAVTTAPGVSSPYALRMIKFMDGGMSKETTLGTFKHLSKFMVCGPDRLISEGSNKIFFLDTRSGKLSDTGYKSEEHQYPNFHKDSLPYCMLIRKEREIILFDNNGKESVFNAGMRIRQGWYSREQGTVLFKNPYTFLETVVAVLKGGLGNLVYSEYNNHLAIYTFADNKSRILKKNFDFSYVVWLDVKTGEPEALE